MRRATARQAAPTAHDARVRILESTVPDRSEEHTSELQSRQYLVCRLLLEKKKNKTATTSRQRKPRAARTKTNEMKSCSRDPHGYALPRATDPSSMRLCWIRSLTSPSAVPY